MSWGTKLSLLSRVLLAALLVASSCARERTEPTGGETHFLRRCEPASNSCGDLSCICGVCSLPCGDENACGSLSRAMCLPPPCDDPTAPSQCDVPCGTDDECARLSSTHRCEGGVCRAPSAEACTDDGVAANEVLVIGDSFFALNHQITAYLEDQARGSGALSVGERYRDNSRLTANALALGGNGISDQYADAAEEARVKVVIMNGGGADVLLGDCAELSPECPLLGDAVNSVRVLLARMADDGVLHVVYAFYPDPLDTAVRERMDVLRPLVEKACAESRVPCHFLDLRSSFADHYGEYVLNDGLNPSSAGAKATAEAVWATLRRFCVAQ